MDVLGFNSASFRPSLSTTLTQPLPIILLQIISLPLIWLENQVLSFTEFIIMEFNIWDW